MADINDYVEKSVDTVLILTELGPGGVDIKLHTSIDRVVGAPIVGTLDPVDAVPGMVVEYPRNMVGIGEEECRVTAPLSSVPFLADITTDRASALYLASIYEMVTARGARQTNRMFSGRLVNATRHPDGLPDTVRLELRGSKAFLNVQAGFPVDQECPWIFGGPGCNKSFVGLTEDVRLLSVDGLVVRTAPLSTPRPQWHFVLGTFDLFRAQVLIRAWDPADQTRFTLFRPPPLAWINQIVRINPGCVRSRDVCTNVWANQAGTGGVGGFGGIGIKMSDRNPLMEAPSDASL